MKHVFSKINKLSLSLITLNTVGLLSQPPAFAAGAPRPTPTNSVPTGIADSYFVDAETEGFQFHAISGFGLKPECMKSSGIKLLILDAGHDDTSASIRSDAKIRGGNGKYIIQWPEVHEGQLNMTTSYLAYSYIMNNPSLTPAQRAELQTMVRFTRLPGEAKFGQYESEDGYGSIGGTITHTITNRASRVNSMMINQRPFDSKTGTYSKSTKTDVRNQALLVSVHANSSEYYDEGDHVWIIPPKSQSKPTEVSRYLASFQDGFSSQMGDYFEVDSSDSSFVASLKRGSQSSAKRDNIRISKHSTDLTMLSTQISTPYKFLSEGFVMNGKVGHLAYNEIKTQSPKKLTFKRKGKLVKSYSVTELYLTYARSLVESLQTQLGCSF